MATIMRPGPYRIYFHSHEPNEPPHVHVDRNSSSVKIWLAPVSIVRNIGFSPRELRKIENMVTDNKNRLLEAWHAYFRY